MAQPFENSIPDYISTKETGWLFNRSDATIRRWCHAGKLRFRQVGKDIDVNFQHAVEVSQLSLTTALAIIARRRQQEQEASDSPSDGSVLPPGQLRHTATLQAA